MTPRKREREPKPLRFAYRERGGAHLDGAKYTDREMDALCRWWLKWRAWEKRNKSVK